MRPRDDWRAVALGAGAGLVVLVAVMVVSLLVLQAISAKEQENSIRGCERGNVVRKSISNVATLIQSNLETAIEADASSPESVEIYADNIHILQEIKINNRQVDCEESVGEPPGFLP